MASPKLEMGADIWNEVVSLITELHPVNNNNGDGRRKDVMIYRRSKQLRDGDAIIPRGRLCDISPEDLLRICSELESRSQTWLIPVSCGQPTNDMATVFHLDRPHAFHHVLQCVQTHNTNYGIVTDKKHHNIVINCGPNKSADQLDYVREIILLDHIIQLLIANGYSVAGIVCQFTQQNTQLLQLLNAPNIASRIIDSSLLSESVTLQSELCQSAQRSIHRHHISTSNTNKDEVEPNQIIVDLKSYLDSEEGSWEKARGFDKNLHLVKVSEAAIPAPLMLHLCQLHSSLNQLQQNECERVTCCIHFVPVTATYVQQQVHLTWNILADNPKQLHQTHVEYGSTTRRKNLHESIDSPSAEEYYRLRKLQMENAAALKYGGFVREDAKWNQTINNLTDACIKFEILATNHRNLLKLDLCNISPCTEDSADNNAGPFVMYNCARLAMLFQKFDNGVKKGVYPRLPSLSHCDMTLLKLEEEWTLLYNFVEPFGRLVGSTIPCLGDTLYLNIQTHKVVGFLVSLSHCLSSYYSRVHVLGEPLKHLLPLMFARLHLLNAVHQVMVNGLKLLNIEPVSQL
ncbi:DALR anticodon-binding domain-containing protein 3-like [Argonauta hians]